jgi:hypothetical protein
MVLEILGIHEDIIKTYNNTLANKMFQDMLHKMQKGDGALEQPKGMTKMTGTAHVLRLSRTYPFM